jgi:Zinc finger, C3HC4 type (RING finger)
MYSLFVFLLQIKFHLDGSNEQPAPVAAGDGDQKSKNVATEASHSVAVAAQGLPVSTTSSSSKPVADSTISPEDHAVALLEMSDSKTVPQSSSTISIPGIERATSEVEYAESLKRGATATIRFKMHSRTPIVVEVLYGLRFSAIQQVHASRYVQINTGSQSDEKKKEEKHSGSSDAVSGISEAGIEMVQLFNGWFSDEVCVHRDISESFPPGMNCDITVPIDLNALARSFHGGARYPLCIGVRSANGEQEHSSPDSPAIDRFYFELTMLQFPQVKKRRTQRVVPLEKLNLSHRVDGQLAINQMHLLEMLEIYGLDSSHIDDCSVCLTDKRDIVNLPCRHCCVCYECFENLGGKCPVCRSQIRSFLRFEGDVPYHPHAPGHRPVTSIREEQQELAQIAAQIEDYEAKENNHE